MIASGAGPLQDLEAAARAGDADALRALLARQPELTARLDEPLPGAAFGETALLVAVGRADRGLVDALLAAGANIDQRSHWWAGSFGVLDGESPLVEYLVARGAAVDAYAAARHGWIDRLRGLLEQDGTRARMRGGDGQTPLHVAASVEVAELLLAHGAELDALDVDHESTPAQYLVRDRPDVARYLIERGARTDLLLAAALGDAGRVRRHLDADPETVAMAVTERWFPRRDPRSGGTIYNWTLGRHWSAHRVARELGHPEVLELLYDRSPPALQLAAACELGERRRVEALLAARPELRGAPPAESRRLLVDAAQDGDLGAVDLMLLAGWPLDARGQHQATALHWAAFHGHAEMVRELLVRRPPLEIRDQDFHGTPLAWALYGSLHSWRRRDGDYGAAVSALVAAGALRPPRLDAVEASEPALAALRG